MGNKWRDCIIAYYDLPGVKKLASQSGSGSALMRKLHALAVKEIPNLTAVAHAYVWNDSVLLLFFVDKSRRSFAAAMKDADYFKRQVDCLKKSYAVAVKGQTFPAGPASNFQHQVTVLQASSWAMANCFAIEKELKRLRSAWYVDHWIASKLTATTPSTKHKVTLFPSGQPRVVHAYKDYLWNHAV